ncbi:hypothetical protein ACJJTC_005625 [Scirpophaga incertulas]
MGCSSAPWKAVQGRNEVIYTGDRINPTPIRRRCNTCNVQAKSRMLYGVRRRRRPRVAGATFVHSSRLYLVGTRRGGSAAGMQSERLTYHNTFDDSGIEIPPYMREPKCTQFT